MAVGPQVLRIPEFSDHSEPPEAQRSDQLKGEVKHRHLHSYEETMPCFQASPVFPRTIC